MPRLTETMESTLPEVLTKVTSVESQLAAMKEKLVGSVQANEMGYRGIEKILKCS